MVVPCFFLSFALRQNEPGFWPTLIDATLRGKLASIVAKRMLIAEGLSDKGLHYNSGRLSTTWDEISSEAEILTIGKGQAKRPHGGWMRGAQNARTG
jgi:hypothetical protein